MDTTGNPYLDRFEDIDNFSDDDDREYFFQDSPPAAPQSSLEEESIDLSSPVDGAFSPVPPEDQPPPPPLEDLTSCELDLFLVPLPAIPKDATSAAITAALNPLQTLWVTQRRALVHVGPDVAAAQSEVDALQGQDSVALRRAEQQAAEKAARHATRNIKSKHYVFTFNSTIAGPHYIRKLCEEPRIAPVLVCCVASVEVGEFVPGTVEPLVASTGGNIHLQGVLEFNKDVRLNTLTSILPGCHFEIRKGTFLDACLYACKRGPKWHLDKTSVRPLSCWLVGTLLPKHEWNLSSHATKSSALHAAAWLDLKKSEEHIAKEFAEHWLRGMYTHGRTLRLALISAENKRKYEANILSQFPPDKLYRWQFALCVLLDLQDKHADGFNAGGRKIYFLHDPDGNIGKTMMCHLLAVRYGAQVIGSGSRHNLASMVDPQASLIVFDYPRTAVETDDKGNVNDYRAYGLFEEISNNRVFNTKYHASVSYLTPNIQLVFSNHSPNAQGKLSADRVVDWRINHNSRVIAGGPAAGRHCDEIVFLAYDLIQREGLDIDLFAHRLC